MKGKGVQEKQCFFKKNLKNEKRKLERSDESD